MHSSLSPGLCFLVSSLEVTGWSRDEALLLRCGMSKVAAAPPSCP